MCRPLASVRRLAKSAPVRLPLGDHLFGELHISRPERARSLRSAGFDDPAEFVRTVASEFTEIRKAKRSSLSLVKRSDDKAPSLFVEIKRLDGDAAYEVLPGSAFRSNFHEAGRENSARTESETLQPQLASDPCFRTPPELPEERTTTPQAR